MTPTDIEDRLRQDLAAEAARTQATMLRPLAGPDRASRLAGRRLGVPLSTRRWLAPAAAVVAVAAVLAGVTLAGSGLRGRPGAASGGTAAGVTPRFYLALTVPPHARIVVHNSRTGRVVSSQPLPRSVAGLLPLVAAAGNDRVFDIADTAGLPQSRTSLGLLTVKISDRGQIKWLIATHHPLGSPGAVAEGIALSPDGSKLAVTVQISAKGLHPRGEIMAISRGRTRTWSAGAGIPLDPAWLAGGRKLGFLWWDHLHYHGGGSNFTARTQERLLNTSAPGPSLLASSKMIAAAPKGDFLASAELSADGRMLIGSWFRNVPSGTSRGTADLVYGQLAVAGHRPGFEVGSSARYSGAAQEHAADFSCRVLSMAERHYATLIECPKLAQVYSLGRNGWVVGGPAASQGRIAAAAW